MSSPTESDIQNNALFEFIEGKLVQAVSDLNAREQSEKTWRGGTDEMWYAVGCRKTRPQRLKEADAQAHIAAKLRREVAMFKAILKRLR